MGQKALQKVENVRKPMLWDADALNLLAINPDKRHNRVITPHPGEAARLLGCSVAEIESDRLLSAQRLVKRYGGVVVLKGAGTIIAAEHHPLAIIDAGNAGMASGGWAMSCPASSAHCSDRSLPRMMRHVWDVWLTARRRTYWQRVMALAACWRPIFYYAAAYC